MVIQYLKRLKGKVRGQHIEQQCEIVELAHILQSSVVMKKEIWLVSNTDKGLIWVSSEVSCMTSLLSRRCARIFYCISVSYEII